jgi:hypothetical protein
VARRGGGGEVCLGGAGEGEEGEKERGGEIMGLSAPSAKVVGKKLVSSEWGKGARHWGGGEGLA